MGGFCARRMQAFALTRAKSAETGRYLGFKGFLCLGAAKKEHEHALAEQRVFLRQEDLSSARASCQRQTETVTC